MFANYLLDILRILSEYKKATKVPKIATTEGTFAPSGLKILEIQEYFYNYLLKKIPDSEKTDSMNEYMEYLRKEIISKKKFSSKPEHFALNQIFSFFPKGFDFHFDYENIEIVAYDKDNVVSSKIIVPSNELVLSLTFTKIFVKLLDLEIEITDLNKCETIIEQLKDLAKDKFKVVQIVLEPCYKQIKDGIEPILNDDNIGYTQILNEQKNNLLRGQPLASSGSELERQYNLKKEEEKRRIQQQMLLQRQKEERELLLRQQQERLRLQKENEERQKQIQLQKQKEELLKRQQLEQQERERQKQLEKQRPQNKVPLPQQKFQNQISNQQHNPKNQMPKYTNINSTKVNSSSNASNKGNYLINQKIPKDNVGNNKSFGNVKNTNINNNILPKMQRQISGSYHEPLDKESYSIFSGNQGSIRYNTGENINHLNNVRYGNYINNTGPNVNNNIKLYYQTEKPHSYGFQGNMNNIPTSGNNSNYI